MKKININLITILIISIILLIIISGGSFLYQKKVTKLKNEIENEIKLKNALLDKISFYQNKEKEWVAEKLTIQTSLKNLEQNNTQLTDIQKELIKRINEIEKSNSIIAAALIETNVKIDSLKQGNVAIDSTDNKIIFSDSTKNIKYKITVNGVIPAFKDTLPSLIFNKFLLPNKQFIEFHWKNDRKKGYPISFSVSNSNDYFKTINIDSYAIPKLQKEIVDPNGWQKFGKWMKNNTKNFIIVGVAGGIGITGGVLFF